ncbi:TPA: hypothetical protein HA244_03610 [Candidatus Micrarchaeota archaeon]|nr:hypothetical protein [Candidatus Micrarchaeota archaeon]
MSEKDLEDYVETLKNLEANNPGTVLRLMQAYEKDLEEARIFSDGIASLDLPSLGDKELLVKLNDFRKLNQRIFRRAYHYVMLNKFYPDLVTADVASAVAGVEEQSEVLNVFFTADKPSDVRKEKEDLVRIAETALTSGFDSPDVSALVEEHLQKYAFLGMYFFGRQPYSKQDVLERLKHLAGKDLAKEKADLQKQALSGEKTRELISRLKLSEETALKIQTVKEIAFAANDFDEAYTYLGFKMRPFFTEIAGRLGLDYKQLIQMLPYEIGGFLESGKKADDEFKAHLDLRAQDHALIYEQGKIGILTGEEFQKYYAEEKKLEEDFTHLRELKGQAASPGVVRGIVRILLTSTDLNKVRKGEVLVAPATTPAYVPAMERAAAIVTNEGGLLSHAAIVARELGVPCVVGTKIATKALRDGEMVEVDATKGIVKKLG